MEAKGERNNDKTENWGKWHGYNLRESTLEPKNDKDVPQRNAKRPKLDLGIEETNNKIELSSKKTFQNAADSSEKELIINKKIEQKAKSTKMGAKQVCKVKKSVGKASNSMSQAKSKNETNKRKPDNTATHFNASPPVKKSTVRNPTVVLQPARMSTEGVQPARISTGEVEPARNPTKEVQPARISTAGVVQLSRNSTGEVEPARNLTEEVEPTRNITGEFRPARNSTGEFLPARISTGGVQPATISIGGVQVSVQPTRNSTGGGEPARTSTGEVEPARNPTGGVQPARMSTGGIQQLQPHRMSTIGVQPATISIGGVQVSVQPSRNSTGRGEPARTSTGAVQPPRMSTGGVELTRMSTGRIQQLQPVRMSTVGVQPATISTGGVQPARISIGGVQVSVQPASNSVGGGEPARNWTGAVSEYEFDLMDQAYAFQGPVFGLAGHRLLMDQAYAFVRGILSTQDVGHPPLDPITIGLIPKIEISESQVLDRSSCSICFDEFFVGEEVKALNCEHMFHAPCIDRWLHLHGTCPVCREVINPLVLPAASVPMASMGFMSHLNQPGDAPYEDGNSVAFDDTFE